MLLHNLADDLETRNAPITTPARAMDVTQGVAGVGESTAVTPTIYKNQSLGV